MLEMREGRFFPRNIVCGLNRGRDRQNGIQFRIDDAQGDLITEAHMHSVRCRVSGVQ
jgi:hypothetical protein